MCRGGPPGAVAHRVAERAKASIPSPFDGLHAIGVDETSHRKGHTCLTVVVDHERHRVIRAHDGVGGDAFDLFFKALTPERRASIRIVTGDGARWIDSCVGRWCPNAERVPDGFHMFLVKSVFRVSSLIFFGFRHEACRPVVCFTGCPSCRT